MSCRASRGTRDMRTNLDRCATSLSAYVRVRARACRSPPPSRLPALPPLCSRALCHSPSRSRSPWHTAGTYRLRDAPGRAGCRTRRRPRLFRVTAAKSRTSSSTRCPASISAAVRAPPTVACVRFTTHLVGARIRTGASVADTAGPGRRSNSTTPQYGPSHCTFASPTHFFIQTRKSLCGAGRRAELTANRDSATLESGGAAAALGIGGGWDKGTFPKEYHAKPANRYVLPNLR